MACSISQLRPWISRFELAISQSFKKEQMNLERWRESKVDSAHRWSNLRGNRLNRHRHPTLPEVTVSTYPVSHHQSTIIISLSNILYLNLSRHRRSLCRCQGASIADITHLNASPYPIYFGIFGPFRRLPMQHALFAWIGLTNTLHPTRVRVRALYYAWTTTTVSLGFVTSFHINTQTDNPYHTSYPRNT